MNDDKPVAFPLEHLHPGLHERRPDIAAAEAEVFLRDGHKSIGVRSLPAPYPPGTTGKDSLCRLRHPSAASRDRRNAASAPKKLAGEPRDLPAGGGNQSDNRATFWLAGAVLCERGRGAHLLGAPAAMKRMSRGRTPVRDRATPFLDAWVAHLRDVLAPRGMQSELARHLSGPDGPRRWSATFSKWFRRENLPGAEEVLAINQWLATRPESRKNKRTDG